MLKRKKKQMKTRCYIDHTSTLAATYALTAYSVPCCHWPIPSPYALRPSFWPCMFSHHSSWHASNCTLYRLWRLLEKSPAGKIGSKIWRAWKKKNSCPSVFLFYYQARRGAFPLGQRHPNSDNKAGKKAKRLIDLNRRSQVFCAIHAFLHYDYDQFSWVADE